MNSRLFLSNNSTPILSSKKLGIKRRTRQWKPSLGKGFYKDINLMHGMLTHIKIKAKENICVHSRIQPQEVGLLLCISANGVVLYSQSENTPMQSAGNYILPHAEHQWNITKGGDFELITIVLKRIYFNQLFFPSNELKNTSLAQLFDRQSTPKRLNLTHSLKASFVALLESEQAGICHNMLLHAKIFEIFSIIFNQEMTQESQHLLYRDRLEKVKDIISSQLHIQYSICNLSKMVGINECYLKKYFKELFGETIFEYATKLRIQKAQELLIQSDLPVAIISEKVGYQNPPHFSFAFKKNVGISPYKYRTQMIIPT
ncbi:AraC family transcriptional regulator [Limibacter armeniacum]|uniref:helix-turn-helix domain-containing protein n=1 Tax=Limibacter armeniacum TaxID=466084 RepID=UPI002FE57A00